MDLRSCNMMASIKFKRSTRRLSSQTEEHKLGQLAVEALLSGKNVMAILPTGFGKSIIYQSFAVAKHLGNTFSYLIFWSPNNNGRFARLCTASRLSVDSSTSSLSPFRLFSIADPGDFASLLNRRISSGFWSCSLSYS